MNKFGIGQPVRRAEDQRFITGRGRYVDDIDLPRQAYGALLTSPHPHARIRGIDKSKALASHGVICVLTGADALTENLGGLPPLFMPEDMGGPKGYRTHRALLAADKARYVGDRVAFVVAETAAQAREAAELVEVDYETLPDAVQGLERGSKSQSPWTKDVGCLQCLCITMQGKGVRPYGVSTNAAIARGIGRQT